MNKGNYHYSKMGANGELSRYVCRVEILEVCTGGFMTRVKLLQYHADGRKPGTEMKVRSKNVKPDAPTNGLRDVLMNRLPYKDED